MLAVGTVIGGALAALGRAGTKVAAARVALGSILAFGGFVLGFLGCLFVMFWTLTDHQVAYRNENILQCAPWVIALAGVGVGLARGKAPAMEKAWKLTRAAAAASILGLVCKVLPFFDQNNSEIIALMLPVWVGAAAGTWFLRSASVTPAPAVTPAPVATPSS